MRSRVSKKSWFLIVGFAVLVHFLILLFVRPGFFEFFKKRTDSPGPAVAFDPLAGPDVFLSIPVEIEGEEEDESASPSPAVVDIEPSPESDHRPAPIDPGQAAGERRGASTDLLDPGRLAAGGRRPSGAQAGGPSLTVPPRPIEITWPDTRRLKSCLGHEIDVRIEVSDLGKVLRVQAADAGHPPECLRAALESARRIVFAPGLIDGKPVTMWTEVRIDFKRKR